MSWTDAQVLGILADEAHAWCAARQLDRVRSLWVVLAANAYGESRLNEYAVGDGGLSVGLFQAHTTKGLGSVWIRAGGTREQLTDPTTITRLILWEADRVGFPSHLRDGTLGSAVGAFVRLVERPADPTADTIKRQAFARHFSGGVSLDTPCARFM